MDVGKDGKSSGNGGKGNGGRKKVVQCCMCGRKSSQLNCGLVSGQVGHVCFNCLVAGYNVGLSTGNIPSDLAPKESNVKPKGLSLEKIPTPRDIKAYLDQHIIGQDKAKKVLAVAVHNHYMRISRQNDIPEGHPLEHVEMSKSNVLLTGPTGTGKTLLAQTLAKMLQVPFAMADATTLTEAGYVGEDVESMLLTLYKAANGDVKKAEMGIVYIDEIDKVARKETGVSITRDVSGEGTQQALLKIIEGTVAGVPLVGGRKHPQAEQVKIDTTNVLFICGGAFVGLDKIVEKRLGGKKVSLGFGAEESKVVKKAFKVEPEDLLSFGLIPELIGRLPLTCSLDQLERGDLLRILVEPRNALVRQYEKLVLLNGAKLEFSQDAMEEVVRIAIERKTGARGLRSVMEEVMGDILFGIEAGQDIRVDRQVVLDSTMGKVA